MDLVSLAGALAMGLGLGVITGMPLGVINVAIVDAVIAGERSHARGLALGGALADATHALLAFVGLGRLVTARPQYTRFLAIVASLAIIVFAIASWRRRLLARTRDAASADASAMRDAASTSDTRSTRDAATHDAATPPRGSPRVVSTNGVLRGALSGIALTLPNPVALAAWVAVAAMTWPDASTATAATVALGVGVGSGAWFLLLGSLIAKVPPDHRTLRIVPKVALVLFVAIALGGVVRSL